MTNLNLSSKGFDYITEYGVAREWLDYFFPYFILMGKDGKIKDTGRLWVKLHLTSNLENAFKTKETDEKFSTKILNSYTKEMKFVLIHQSSGIRFRSEFFNSFDESEYLGIFSPKIVSDSDLNTLDVVIKDFPSTDSTIDCSFLIITQKNLLAEQNSLVNKLKIEKAKLKDWNNNLESIVAERNNELDLARRQSFHAAKMASLGEMSGSIAHEINNPLAIISANMDYLKKSYKKGKLSDENFYTSIDEIETTIQRMSKIISGLRDISRDASEEQFEKIKVKDILNDVVGLCEERFEAHRVDFNYPNSDSILDEIFSCRRVQLSQVFINLLGNAFDAVENLEERWIELTISKLKNDKMEFRFTDSGNGIPLGIQDKIMQPFFTTKEVGKGTGLGLSISDSIIKSHGGKIYIDNNNKNTCFVVELTTNSSKDESLIQST